MCSSDLGRAVLRRGRTAAGVWGILCTERGACRLFYGTDGTGKRNRRAVQWILAGYHQYFPESKGIFAAGREKDALRLHAAWVSGCAVPEDSAQKTSSCAMEITCFCIFKTAKGFKTIKSPDGLENSTWPDLFALLFQKPLIQLEFLRQIIHQLRLV